MPKDTKGVTHGTASLLSLLALAAAQPAQAKTQAPPDSPITQRLAAVRERLEPIKEDFTPITPAANSETLLAQLWEDVWINFNDGAYWEDIWSDFSN